MPIYIARIELHPSRGKRYNELHAFMERMLGYRKIIADDGRIYALPEGTYNIVPNFSVSAMHIARLLRPELFEAGFEALLLVCECEATAFALDETTW